MDLKVTWDTLLQICGGVSVIGACITLVFRAMSPVRSLKVEVSKHAHLLDNDNKRLLGQDETNRQICLCLLALMDNAITGNSIDKLKEARAGLTSYIVNKLGG